MGEPVEDDGVLQARFAVGECAGLVEADGVDLVHRLDRCALLDQGSSQRGVADRGNQRGRGGKHHHAGAEHDHHRDRSRRLAGDDPQSGGEHQRDRCVEPGVAVEHPLDRCLLPLGILDHPPDLTERRLSADPHRADLERTEARQRSANTPSPAPRSTAMLSPVIAAWSTDALPSRTSPSTGIRSPGRTSTTSSTATSS